MPRSASVSPRPEIGECACSRLDAEYHSHVILNRLFSNRLRLTVRVRLDSRRVTLRLSMVGRTSDISTAMKANTTVKNGQSISANSLDGVISKQEPHWWVRAVENATSSQILLLLIGLRLLNSLVTKTFFQPDEYFQSLEPAWRIAFGEGSGAWLTWVRSRSSLGHVMSMC